MAISYTHYKLLLSLKPLLPQGGTLLEIGEANWYGDLDARDVFTPFQLMDFADNLFGVAKVFYQSLFAPSRIVSVDMNGTEAALKYDLNQRLPVDVGHVGDRCYEAFDVSINHGTAEHVFNIAQVFRTMHDWTVDGGLMIHEAPCTGWLDHGFYLLQPTLFYDLAAANGYTIELIALEEIASRTILHLETRDSFAELAKAGRVPMNSMLFVAMRKAGGAFKIPWQGIYGGQLSEAGKKAWSDLR